MIKGSQAPEGICYQSPLDRAEYTAPRGQFLQAEHGLRSSDGTQKKEGQNDQLSQIRTSGHGKKFHMYEAKINEDELN